MQEKRTKKCLVGYFNNHKAVKLSTVKQISRNDLTEFENKIMRLSSEEVLQHNQANECWNDLMSTIGHIVDKFMKQCKRPQGKIHLPWLSDNVLQLMKQRDYPLKSFFKTRNDTDWQLCKGLKKSGS